MEISETKPVIMFTDATNSHKINFQFYTNGSKKGTADKGIETDRERAWKACVHVRGVCLFKTTNVCIGVV